MGTTELLTALTLHNGTDAAVRLVPITVGVPFPRGDLLSVEGLQLRSPSGDSVPLQYRGLARWSDESVQWVLLDFVAPVVEPGASQWELRTSEDDVARADVGAGLRVEVRSDVLQVLNAGGSVLASLGFPLQTKSSEVIEPRALKSHWETVGPVRSTLVITGRFRRSGDLRFHARLSVFAGTGLMRLEVRLHNPNRARHRGGLWDLGDPNSVLFRSFAVAVLSQGPVSGTATDRSPELSWQTAPEAPWHATDAGELRIVQHSSGGPAWNSASHMNSEGLLPVRRQGFTVVAPDCDEQGLRATPLVGWNGGDREVFAVVPEFWQQFPKSIEADAGGIRIGLFPETTSDLHELQPGEQKTHTLWLRFAEPTSSGSEIAEASAPGASSRASSADLEWMRQPVAVTLSPEWYARSATPAFVVPVSNDTEAHLTDFLRGALTGDLNLAARRDHADEYGWRHFGDMPADHEQEHYAGRETVVSHYNNQFDGLFGAIVQCARTGEPGWRELIDPLARHVVDIDLYHTDRDRAAYNGGLFWHTDHYRTAGRSTHRTYSADNQAPEQPYGGGPSCEHNYTTGLLHYYWMTGNPDARDAVLELAGWVRAMDDGRQSLFGLVDSGPTGLATATTEESYHGPGRGAGNSLNALIDAWLLTRDREWMTAASGIVRRVVHPQQDLEPLSLLHAEKRWSYTVFLVALSRWLEVKAEANQIDADYAYGQASLLHYARWMAQHERPYFDREEELEYPTATWAAQELRKANVLRIASRHAVDPERSEFLRRGDELGERAWKDLERFDNRFVARCLHIVMTEGAREAWFRDGQPAPLPRAETPANWPPHTPFVPQKTRIKAALRSPRGLARMMLQALNVFRWPATLRLLARQL
jgi:hypothetical protein